MHELFPMIVTASTAALTAFAALSIGRIELDQPEKDRDAQAEDGEATRNQTWFYQD